MAVCVPPPPWGCCEGQLPHMGGFGCLWFWAADLTLCGLSGPGSVLRRRWALTLWGGGILALLCSIVLWGGVLVCAPAVGMW